MEEFYRWQVPEKDFLLDLLGHRKVTLKHPIQN